MIKDQAANLDEGVVSGVNRGAATHSLDVVDATRPTDEFLRRLPAGCSFVDLGDRVVVRATLQSLIDILPELAIALFWNGFSLFFLLLAVLELYFNLVGPFPNWFPAPPINKHLDLGETLIALGLLILFFAIGFALSIPAFLYAYGRVEIEVADSFGEVRIGVASAVWSRCFDPMQFQRIGAAWSRWGERDRRVIVLEADRKIIFGSMLTDARREWLEAILHELLIQKDHANRLEVLNKIFQHGGSVRPSESHLSLGI